MVATRVQYVTTQWSFKNILKCTFKYKNQTSPFRHTVSVLKGKYVIIAIYDPEWAFCKSFKRKAKSWVKSKYSRSYTHIKIET